MEKKKFDSKIQFKLTSKENSQIEEFAEKYRMTKSETIRMCIDVFFEENRNNKIWARDKRYKKEVLFCLRVFGNHVNDIAHRMNIAVHNENFVGQNIIDIKKCCKDIERLQDLTAQARDIVDKRL